MVSGPAYQRVAESLRSQISDGQWAAGDRLPGELELMKQFAVSRNTVRQALDLLSQSNLVRRHQGRGTFVAEQGVSHVLGDLRSFTRILEDLGFTPGIADVSIAPDENPPAEAADFLPGSRIWCIRRVRTADGRPFSLMKSWLPDGIGAGITAAKLLQHQSLYALLAEQHDLVPSEATETIRAEAADAEDAAALNIPQGTPLLTIYRWTTDSRGQAIEFVRSTSPGDRYQYVIKLHQ